MKMVFVLYALVLVVKMTVAITERPHTLFDALHESGEAREVAERTRMEVAFFVEAVERVRRAAFVWTARVWERLNEILPQDDGAFRKDVAFGEFAGSPKRAGMSLRLIRRVNDESKKTQWTTWQRTFAVKS